jgi:hypothetical protein
VREAGGQVRARVERELSRSPDELCADPNPPDPKHVDECLSTDCRAMATCIADRYASHRQEALDMQEKALREQQEAAREHERAYRAKCREECLRRDAGECEARCN